MIAELASGRRLASPRLLVVEDEPLIAMFVVDSLEDQGFLVDEAASAGDAMRKLDDREGAFAAVIIDIGLPDRPGDALAADVRRRWRELPVIIASGQTGTKLARELAAGDLVRLVSKPYDVTTLLDALAAVGVSPGTSGLSASRIGNT